MTTFFALFTQRAMRECGTMTLHKRYKDVFLMDDIPEAERKEVAKEVVEKISSGLAELGTADPGTKCPA